MQLLKINVEPGPLRLLLAAATVSALIEMPLVWLRLKGEAQLFMYYTMGRTALQAASTWSVLALGLGVSGVMVGNSIILLSFAAFLSVRQWRATGAMVSMRCLRRIRDYGLPLVGAALAMFAVGNANRLFLTGHVTDAEIAHFGIASRLALATALIYYPFELWWIPQRIRILNEKDGLQRSAATWGLGYSILLTSAMSVALVGPSFIIIALPASYEQAAYLLPFLVAVQFFNFTGSLSNVGCLVRENSVEVLAIDFTSAIIALLGYYFLVPLFGLWGAIASMTAAFSARLALYLIIGHAMAPINYPKKRALIATLTAIALIYLAPDKADIFLRAGWSVISLTLLGVLLYKMGMVQLPKHIQEQILGMVRHVR